MDTFLAYEEHKIIAWEDSDVSDLVVKYNIMSLSNKVLISLKRFYSGSKVWGIWNTMPYRQIRT